MSAYVLFCNDRRSKIIEQSETNLKVTEVITSAADEWRKASKHTKALYQKKAKSDVERFN